MSMKNAVKYARTTLDYTYSNARIIPYGGLLIPGEMLKAIDFDKKVDKYTKPTKDYKNSEILKAMLIGIFHGDVDFEAIHETDDDPEFFCNAMHMQQMPSEATMRQRMDCFLQAPFEQKCKIKMYNVACTKCTMLQPAAPIPV